MGLSLHDAWRVSPRTLRLVAHGRNDAALDDLELQIHASFAGEWFARQKTLRGESLKAMMPKRRGHETSPDAILEAELSKWDNWAKGVNKRFARIDEAKEGAVAAKAARAAVRAARQGKKPRPADA